MISKKKIIILACVVLAVAVVLVAVLSRQSKSDYYGSDVGTVITEKKLAGVSEVLRQAGLSNTDLFETWVYEYFEGKDDDTSPYSDTDSLMTTMLLADDQVRCEKRKPYKGEHLKEDLRKMNDEDGFIFIRDNAEIFTALFGEMSIPKSGIEDALPTNWKKHDMEFINEKSSIVSVVSPAKDKDKALVSHAGILVDMEGMETDLKGKYLFVEKLDYGDAFYATELESPEELLELFSQRGDLKSAEGETLVYVNDRNLGEI